MKTASPTKLILTGVLFALVVVAWVNLGPRQLGGSVSYVMTHGVSMQPRYHQGDLVIVREGGPYEVGDVIAYNSKSLQEPVMHRIVDETPAGYVTKGDNNQWLDTDRPKDVDVIGKAWIHIPGGGKPLAWVSTPRGASAVASAMGLFLFTGNRKRSRHQRGEGSKMQQISVPNLMALSVARQVTLGCIGVVALLSLLIGLLSFTKDPVRALSQEAAYEHTGTFGYAAEAKRGPVYRDGKVTTGEPLFLKLIDDLEVSFRYELVSEAQADIAGSAALAAVVKDANGWSESFPLQRTRRFNGSSVRLSGVLDPDRILQLTNEVQTLTGVAGNSYTVSLEPVVETKGTVGGEDFAESFTPTFAFALDGLQLKAQSPAPGETIAGAADPFKPSVPGSIKTSQLETNSIGLAGWKVSVAGARKLSFLAFLASVLAAFGLWRAFGSSVGDDEASRIQAQYQPWLVPVTAMQAQSRNKAVRVSTMDGLVRLAERYERMILHEDSDGIHSYFVEEGGVAYYYQVVPPEAKQQLVRPPAAPQVKPKLREEKRKEQRDELRESLKRQLREIEQEIGLKEASDPREES